MTPCMMSVARRRVSTFICYCATCFSHARRSYAQRSKTFACWCWESRSAPPDALVRFLCDQRGCICQIRVSQRYLLGRPAKPFAGSSGRCVELRTLGWLSTASSVQRPRLPSKSFSKAPVWSLTVSWDRKHGPRFPMALPCRLFVRAQLALWSRASSSFYPMAHPANGTRRLGRSMEISGPLPRPQSRPFRLGAVSRPMELSAIKRGRFRCTRRARHWKALSVYNMPSDVYFCRRAALALLNIESEVLTQDRGELAGRFFLGSKVRRPVD
jgi:hypothetical protein